MSHGLALAGDHPGGGRPHDLAETVMETKEGMTVVNADYDALHPALRERARVLALIDQRIAMFQEQQQQRHRSTRVSPLGLLATLRQEVERGG